jgi:hypothetical protein
MKRLITNKKYDIQDARLFAEYNNGLDSSDDESYFEELYLKKAGGYFLYGRGGVNSKWANVKGEGTKILTVEEAQAWVKKHADEKNNYADLWGEAEE